MTRSVLFLRTRPGKREELVRAFERLGVLQAASAQPGFLGAELHVPLDDADHVLVLASWASPEAYQAWLDNPIREAARAELEPLLAAEPEPHLYRVVEAVS